MPRRRRWLIALVVLIPCLAALEVLVRRWESPKSALQIINESDGIIQDLVVTYGDTRMSVGTLLRGQSVRLMMTAGPLGPLRLDYRQKNNPPQSFSIQDFDPCRNLEDGYKQVLVIGNTQMQRYADEDDPPEDPDTLGARLKRWLQAEFSPPQ